MNTSKENEDVLRETFLLLEKVKKHVSRANEILRKGDEEERLIAAQCLKEIAGMAIHPLYFLWFTDEATLKKLAAQNTALPVMVSPQRPPGYKDRIPFRVKRTLSLPIGENLKPPPKTVNKPLGLFLNSCLFQINLVRETPEVAKTEIEKKACELPEIENSGEWKNMLCSWMEEHYPEAFLNQEGPLYDSVQNEAKTVQKKNNKLPSVAQGRIDDKGLLIKGLQELIRKWLSQNLGPKT